MLRVQYVRFSASDKVADCDHLITALSSDLEIEKEGRSNMQSCKFEMIKKEFQT